MAATVERGRQLYKTSVVGISQASGEQVLDVRDTQVLGQNAKKNWQIQVEVSAVPAAGTLAIAYKSPGATQFVDAGVTIDLTAGNQVEKLTFLADYIRLTPAGFDSDKTFSVYLAATQ